MLGQWPSEKSMHADVLVQGDCQILFQGGYNLMNSSRINKIAKARRYAGEPERIQFRLFEVTFQGENTVHTVTFDDGQWQCTCRFFQDWGDCCHSMAMQRILGVTIPVTSRYGIPAGLGIDPLSTLNQLSGS
jgi:hypothetical protein